MEDEIKEIIELINTKYEDYYIDDFLSGEDVKKLVDYITNLQEERYKYKLRCYKALNYIRNNYGLLDIYKIDILDDILIGGDEK